jgi:hypothetical protein
MQQNSMVEKQKLLIDGQELPGLVKVEEIPFEKMIIDVPEFEWIRKVNANVTTMPTLKATYSLQRNSPTLKFMRSWYDNNEVHDVTLKRTDAHGVEFEKMLFQDCENASKNIPAYDAGSPTYAQVVINIIPYNAITL